MVAGTGNPSAQRASCFFSRREADRFVCLFCYRAPLPACLPRPHQGRAWQMACWRVCTPVVGEEVCEIGYRPAAANPPSYINKYMCVYIYVGHLVSTMERSNVDQVSNRERPSSRWGPPFRVVLVLCPTLLVCPDSAGGGFGRACVVSRWQVCLGFGSELFFWSLVSTLIFVGIDKYQYGMCDARNWVVEQVAFAPWASRYLVVRSPACSPFCVLCCLFYLFFVWRRVVSQRRTSRT